MKALAWLSLLLLVPVAAGQWGADTPAGHVVVSEHGACAQDTCIGQAPPEPADPRAEPEPTQPEPTQPAPPVEEPVPAAPAQPTPESTSKTPVAEPTTWALVAALGAAVFAVAAQTGWLVRAGTWVARGTAALFLFSRIQPDKLAKHPLRAQILEIVEAEPGIPIQEIQGRLEVAWGTAVYHLNRLEKERLLVSQRTGNRRLFFIANTPVARLRQSYGLVQKGTSRRIAKTVLDQPGLDQKSVCKMLAIANPTASKHLSRLEKEGLVESEKVSRQRFYRPTPALRQVLGATPA